MRVILTTVKNASVNIKNTCVANINNGYLLLVGFCDGDNEYIADLMAQKIINLRVFVDESDQINLNIFDVDGEILSVSQFTLYADVRKGRRPSFTYALNPLQAQDLYDYFNKRLTNYLKKEVQTGIFGAKMEVVSNNDGPFTLLLDSEKLWPN